MFCVGEPRIEAVDGLSLAHQVIQHINIELELIVDFVPVVDDVRFVRAEADHHEHRQLRD